MSGKDDAFKPSGAGCFGMIDRRFKCCKTCGDYSRCLRAKERRETPYNSLVVASCGITRKCASSPHSKQPDELVKV